MSNSPATDHLQKELAAIAASFERTTHPKWKELMPFKDSIGELRRRGASFKTIATILRNKSISVSHDTVARFCYQVLGEKSPKRKRSVPEGERRNDGAQNDAPSRARKPRPRAQTAPMPSGAERGPRIARVEDL